MNVFIDFMVVLRVLRVVRAMNEALKQERSRKKGQDPDSSSSDGHMLNCSREGKVVCLLGFMSL